MNMLKQVLIPVIQEMMQEVAVESVDRLMMLRRCAEVFGVNINDIDRTIQATGKEAMEKYESQIENIVDANRVMNEFLESTK